MALTSSDFGLSPDERVKSREKAYDSFLNIEGPAAEEQRQAERGALATDVYRGVGQATLAGRPQAGSQILGEGVMQTAKMLPEQAAAQDALTMQGAKMKEDIVGARQGSALNRFVQGTEEAKVKASRELAEKAFRMGLSVQELALHQNGYLADEGLRRMYEDLHLGRVNEADLRKLQQGMALQAERLRQRMATEGARLKAQLGADLAKRDYESAKARLKKYLEMEKEALAASAKANNISAILGGVMTTAGAVVGGIYGGPAGAAVGAKMGSTGAEIIDYVGTR